jgi:hypothetical protein
LMHDMFRQHREVECLRMGFLRRQRERIRHHLYVVLDDAYRMLLMYRRGDFDSIRAARSYLRYEPLVAPVWLSLLLLRPARPLVCRPRTESILLMARNRVRSRA